MNMQFSQKAMQMTLNPGIATQTHSLLVREMQLLSVRLTKVQILTEYFFDQAVGNEYICLQKCKKLGVNLTISNKIEYSFAI